MKSQLQNSISTLGFLALILLLSTFVGCEQLVPDVREDQAATPMASYNPPANPCGVSVFQDLLEVGNDNLMGNVELQNDASQLYATVHPTQGWVITRFALYAGAYTGIPERAGVCQLEQFPYNASLSPAQQVETITVPLSDLDGCTDLCLWVEVGQLDNWGNVSQQKGLYMAGQSYADLAYQSYCVQNCN